MIGAWGGRGGGGPSRDHKVTIKTGSSEFPSTTFAFPPHTWMSNYERRRKRTAGRSAGWSRWASSSRGSRLSARFDHCVACFVHLSGAGGVWKNARTSENLSRRYCHNYTLKYNCSLHAVSKHKNIHVLIQWSAAECVWFVTLMRWIIFCI